jgi:hypothetical protein
MQPLIQILQLAWLPTIPSTRYTDAKPKLFGYLQLVYLVMDNYWLHVISPIGLPRRQYGELAGHIN